MKKSLILPVVILFTVALGAARADDAFPEGAEQYNPHATPWKKAPARQSIKSEARETKHGIKTTARQVKNDIKYGVKNGAREVKQGVKEAFR